VVLCEQFTHSQAGRRLSQQPQLTPVCCSRSRPAATCMLRPSQTPPAVFLCDCLSPTGTQVKSKDKGEAHATITPESVAEDFWELYSKRDLAVWFVKRS
jgi:hypothetical protein